ncbi:hypothetical protein HXX76_000597 [Chlamydomonas incerta]|uniref:Uncharacterized protein n=1 Tax=Chlamydomonas incerta TaxID=51695 RepID=A0A835WEE3_CHLIN|nr:hypothetical protein HXX76_000597 [Chlamydomonas incerta]|eukprot:KAG2445994.1 hypothetical protein HXX76_000597 [Chlamydomonas incerta]
MVCGLICLGAPVLYTENVILRQRIRQKYGLRHSSSCSEMAANCCYPCTLVQAHTLLRERQLQEANALRHSVSKDAHGPLEAAMRAMRRTAASDVARNPAASSDQRRTAQVPQRPDKEAAAAAGAVPGDDAAPARDTQHGGAAAASGGGADELKESLSFTAHAHMHASGEETPDRVTLFGRERPAPVRQLPAASASSASGSRSTSIPPVEYTDSPRMGGGGGASAGAAPTTSFAASSASHNSSAGPHDDAESALTDSASFPVPAALPIPAMVREPPTFAVPPTLKPPDSMDSEVVAAWMQGPKLTHLSQSLQRPAEPEASRNGPVAGPAASSRAGVHHPTASAGSEASLFSIALDPPSLHASPMPLMPGSHGSRTAAAAASSTAVVASVTTAPPEADGLPPLGRVAGPSSIGGSSDGTGRGSSSGGGGIDTITSSKLSAMIDREMLNGGSSGGVSTAGPTPSQSAVFRESSAFRHSAMAPIAEEDAAVAGGATGASTPSASATALPMPPKALTESVALRASVARGRGGGAAAAAAPPRNSTQQRASQQRGGGAVSGSGVGSSRAGGPAVASRGSRGGVAGSALTSLARMGSENGSGGGAAAPGGGNSRRSGPTLQRRVTGGSSSSLATASAAAQPRASAAKADGASGAASQRAAAPAVGADDDMGASADNFSCSRQPPPPPPQPYLHHHAVGGLDDDAVNLASIRPSFIDAPDMEQFKSALRAAGERADAAAAPASATPAGAASSSSLAPAAPASLSASRSASRLGGGTVAVVGQLPRAAAAAAGSRRYGGGGAAAPAAAMYASYCGEGPSHESGDHDSALDDEASSAIDGAVSSGGASSATASSGAAGGSAGAARRRSSAAAAASKRLSRASSSSSRASGATAVEGDGSVSVAVLRPNGLAVGASAAASIAGGVGGPQPATSPSAAVSGLSASKQSASGLSNGDTGAGAYGAGPYDSTADSAVAVSQHRQQTWMNWMAQSFMSGGVGSDAGSSRVMKSGLGKPGMAAVGPGGGGARGGGGGGRGAAVVEPASSCNSVSVNQRDVQDDAASGPVYGRWN